MPTAITTSTAATATAYSNQRKIDRTSNGVLWAVYTPNGGEFYATYSTDDGATWSAGVFVYGAASGSYVGNASFFIDQDDYAHVVVKDKGNGFIYYRRGTPNAGRTAYTWSAAVNVYTSNAEADFPDLVAFRDGAGWGVAIVMHLGVGTCRAQVYQSAIASNGSIGAFARTMLSVDYGGSNKTYPSIDFNHTGDGKTVKDGTPHLYVGWSAGATGAGKGIRFRKATYSAGTWTWNAEREIDSTHYVLNESYFVNCLFDGSAIILGGRFYNGTAVNHRLYERDVADTVTVTLSSVNSDPEGGRGSISYDASRNIYWVGQFGSNLAYRKWTRSSSVMGAYTTIGTTNNSNEAWASLKRGYSNSLIEFVYTDGAASPYTVTYDKIILPALTPYVPMIML